MLEGHKIASAKNKDRHCGNCRFRVPIDGAAHIQCGNLLADVHGEAHGIFKGWFDWPHNFDPVWLKYCDGWQSPEAGGEK